VPFFTLQLVGWGGSTGQSGPPRGRREYVDDVIRTYSGDFYRVKKGKIR
jgi:hypothetical protein